tara:strand:+ start:581 stop:1060 length:480 start_codon:yes stop_codon:yes gene_type:complete
MGHKALYNIALPVPANVLLDEAMSYTDYQPYHDKKTNRYLDDWLQKHITHGHAWNLAQLYKKKLSIDDIKPRYYIQKNTFTLPWHKDRGTECSINFVLTGSASISFRDGNYFYESAILNTQEEHAVFHDKQATDRVLLKLSIFNHTYQEIVERYTNYML